MALTKVLDVPELLENVIFCLPDREIYHNAQRVSHAWKAAIDASPRLLRKSWQRKSKAPVVLPSEFTQINEGDIYEEMFREADVPIYLTLIVVNSHFTHGERLLTNDGILDTHFFSHWYYKSLTQCTLQVRKRLRNDFGHCNRGPAEQTWRSMQLCDPPITVARMQVKVAGEFAEPEGPKYTDLTVYDRDGITMGLVYDTGAAAILSDHDLKVTLKDHGKRWSFVVLFWTGTWIPKLTPLVEESSQSGSEGGDYGEYDEGGDDGRFDEGEGDAGEGDAGDGEAGDGEDEEAEGHTPEERESGENSMEADNEEEEEDSSGTDGSGGDSLANSDMQSVMSTTSRVLAIPELLENIVSFLPEYDILANAQRVSRARRSSVVDSPHIQRKLFLPKGKKPAVSPSRFTNRDFEEQSIGVPMYKQSVVSNYLLETARSLYPHCGVSALGSTCRSQAVPAGEFIQAHDLWVEVYPGGQAAFMQSPDLSWRSMQLCDPPITVANMDTSSGSYMHCRQGICATLFDKDGITLGMAYDTVAAALHSNVGKEDPKNDWSFHVVFRIHEDARDRLERADRISEARGW
jgi:hypothetical protein